MKKKVIIIIVAIAAAFLLASPFIFREEKPEPVSLEIKEPRPEPTPEVVPVLVVEPDPEPVAEPEPETISEPIMELTEIEDVVEVIIEPEPEYLEPTTESFSMPLANNTSFSDEEVMILTNVAYSEAGLTGIDELIQATACIVVNTANWNGCSIYDIVTMTLPSGYYVWLPDYATKEFANNAWMTNPELYAHVQEQVMSALNGNIDVPSDVIYADTQKHGPVWKQYDVDTGWYTSTVYLCYAS